MTEKNAQINAWIDAHQEELLSDLSALVAIPSMKGEAEENRPFGKEPARALEKMGLLMEQYGLTVTNYENYVVAGDLAGREEKTLDILAHLDVVPVSDTWTVTKPFEMKVVGDRIYGRGTIDDKGPAVAALYALRAIRELGIELKNGVRLLCGSDEECGSQDLEYYYAREKEALYTFTPDGNYPVINIEKGRLSKHFAAGGRRQKEMQQRIVSVHSGDKSNVIPGQAELVLEGIGEETARAQAARIAEETGADITIAPSEGRLCITVKGHTGHAAHPEGGLNALTAGLSLAGALFQDRETDEGTGIVLELAKLFPFGDHHGSALSIDYEDAESGRLTITLDILHFENRADTSWALEGCFDCRAPLCANDGNLTAPVRRKLSDIGIALETGDMIPPHYVPADSELVQKLLASYELFFGEKGKPLSIGGGTYVHELERGVAFGCEIEGEDNHMHGDDESMSIPLLVKSAKVFADAVLRLCAE